MKTLKLHQNKLLIGIVDYNTGNLNSLRKSLEIIGYKTLVSSKKNQLKKCSCIILPGVGSFDQAINELKKKKLLNFLKKQIENNKKVLGICLGMQLLCSASDEGKKNAGLNFFTGRVHKLKKSNIGWRSLVFYKHKALFKKFNNKFFYFNHCYFFNKKINMIAKVNSLNIPAILIKKNTIGLQFHPEKSHNIGLQLLKELISTDF